MVPNVVPSFSKDYQGTSCVWDDAATIIPWNLYAFYGNKSIPADSFEGMKAWMDYILRYDGIPTHGGNTSTLATGRPRTVPAAPLTSTRAVLTSYIAYVYYINSAEIAAKAAKILNREAETREYAALAEELRSFIRRE